VQNLGKRHVAPFARSQDGVRRVLPNECHHGTEGISARGRRKSVDFVEQHNICTSKLRPERGRPITGAQKKELRGSCRAAPEAAALQKGELRRKLSTVYNGDDGVQPQPPPDGTNAPTGRPLELENHRCRVRHPRCLHHEIIDARHRRADLAVAAAERRPDSGPQIATERAADTSICQLNDAFRRCSSHELVVHVQSRKVIDERANLETNFWCLQQTLKQGRFACAEEAGDKNDRQCCSLGHTRKLPFLDCEEHGSAIAWLSV
jgi:hypothetical protein